MSRERLYAHPVDPFALFRNETGRIVVKEIKVEE
jgi:hypothetical protein